MTRAVLGPAEHTPHAGVDQEQSSERRRLRNLHPLVLTARCGPGRPRPCFEPIHAFTAEVPPGTAPPVLPVWTQRGGVPLTTATTDSAEEIPAAPVHDLVRAQARADLRRGRVESAFDHYKTGNADRRRPGPAPDANPLGPQGITCAPAAPDRSP